MTTYGASGGILDGLEVEPWPGEAPVANVPPAPGVENSTPALVGVYEFKDALKSGQHGLTPNEVLVALMCSDYASKATGENVRPSGQTLASACGWKKPQHATNIQKRLVAKGWLVLVDACANRPSIYRLSVPFALAVRLGLRCAG